MGYIPNPLNQFDTYTYSIEVFMVHPKDSADYEQNISRGSAIPIMDNMSDSRYNITNLEFISHTGYYPGRNQIQGSFNFTVYEQNGVTLLSKIKESANALGILNHTLAHYLVRIKFIGRDPNGESRTHQDVYTYAMLFTTFTFQVDERGTTYQIEGYENTSAGYQYINNVVQETTTIEAATVGEFVKEFERVYNLAQWRGVQMDSNALYPDQYRINFVGDAKEWLQWEFEELSNPVQSTSINIVDGNKLQIMMQNGSQLTDIIHDVLRLTNEYKKILTSDGGFYREAGSDQPSTETLDKFPVFFKALPEIEYGQYDPLRQDFSKSITFNVKPYVVADLVIDAESYNKGITDPSIQTSRVNKLLSDGLMKKRYDYLYTGSNTEILGLDLKFDMIYYQSTALANGRQGDPNVFAPRSGQDGSATISRLQEASSRVATLRQDELSLPGQERKLRDDANAIQGELSGPGAPSSRGRLTSSLDELLDGARDIQQQLANLPNQLESALAELDAARIQFERESEIENRSDVIPYALRFEGDVINGADHGGTESNLNGGTFQFGAVRQTLENPADLLKIEIFIRGDPYWLGTPKTFESTSGLNTVDYTVGAHHIFLYSNLPNADEDAAGLRRPQPDYQITAVYKVLNTISRFSDGQFVQYLDCVLDTATNASLANDALQSGERDSTENYMSASGAASQNYNRAGVNLDPAGQQESASRFSGQPSTGPGSAAQPLGNTSLPNRNNNTGPF